MHLYVCDVTIRKHNSRIYYILYYIFVERYLLEKNTLKIKNALLSLIIEVVLYSLLFKKDVFVLLGITVLINLLKYFEFLLLYLIPYIFFQFLQ